MFGSRQNMDIAALERRLAEDTQSNSVTPLLVIAEAGSVLTGHCDNISRLREVCDKYNIWLHLRGDSLAALALNNSSKDLVIIEYDNGKILKLIPKIDPKIFELFSVFKNC